MLVDCPRQNVYSRWIFIFCISQNHLEYFIHLQFKTVNNMEGERLVDIWFLFGILEFW